jgi:hypothetical protein
MAPWLLASTLSFLGTQWLLQGCKILLEVVDSRAPNSAKSEEETLGTSFSFFKLPLKFYDQRRKSKRSNSGKNRGRRPPGPTWAGRLGLAGPPCLGGRAGPVFRTPPFFRLLRPWEKVGPVNLHEKLQKTKRKTIYRNPCLVFRPRWDVRADPPW